MDQCPSHCWCVCTFLKKSLQKSCWEKAMKLIWKKRPGVPFWLLVCTALTNENWASFAWSSLVGWFVGWLVGLFLADDMSFCTLCAFLKEWWCQKQIHPCCHFSPIIIIILVPSYYVAEVQIQILVQMQIQIALQRQIQIVVQRQKLLLQIQIQQLSLVHKHESTNTSLIMLLKPKWQSSLQCSGAAGAKVGACFATRALLVKPLSQPFLSNTNPNTNTNDKYKWQIQMTNTNYKCISKIQINKPL